VVLCNVSKCKYSVRTAVYISLVTKVCTAAPDNCSLLVKFRNVISSHAPSRKSISHTGHSKTVDPHYRTCCMSSFWRLDSAGGSQTFGKAVDHCVTHIFRPVGRPSGLVQKDSLHHICITYVAYVVLSALMTADYLAETCGLNICVHPTIRLRMAKYLHPIQFVKMDAALPRLKSPHMGFSW